MTTTGHLRLLDVNVLVALSLPDHAHHEVASARFDDMDQWATRSTTQAAHLRLLMNPRVIGFEITVTDALSGLGGLTSLDDYVFLVDDAPPTELSINFSRLKDPKQVTDPHLVDLTTRHNAVLATMSGHVAQALMSQDRRYTKLIPLWAGLTALGGEPNPPSGRPGVRTATGHHDGSMLMPYSPSAEPLTRLTDRTIKQINPFTGTKV